MKIQFGSGHNHLEGWLNLEFHNGDITKPLAYADNSVDEILAEHVCEHVSGPNMFRFLIEVLRILKSGGVFHISMPVIDHLQPNHARDIILNHGHEVPWTINSMKTVIGLAGFSSFERDLQSFNGKERLSMQRPAIYGHWKIIGEEKDELESYRLRLIK